MCPFIDLIQKLDCKEEVWKGAFIKFEDKGLVYDVLSSQPCKVKSCSCHNSSDFQYRCDKVDSDILFSVTDDCSWIQIERYSPYSNPLFHFCNWIYLLYKSEQCGPLGNSIHTEQNPIVISNEKWRMINATLKWKHRDNSAYVKY